MTFRQILNRLQSEVSEELTEDDILDMDIRVVIPTSLGLKASNVAVDKCYICTEERYSEATHQQEIARRFVAIDTNMTT